MGKYKELQCHYNQISNPTKTKGKYKQLHNNEIVNINHTDRLSKYYHEARQLKKL